jgi:hypothetical protein
MKKTRRAKPTKSVRSVKSVRTVRYNPHKSPIVQGGIVFLIVAAIALVAYVFKNFTP